MTDDRLRIAAPTHPLADDVLERLRSSLLACPDLAFAYLAEVTVEEQPPSNVVFAWLKAGALHSLRSALDLVSGAVASSLPDGEFVDVVILNSAPELLLKVNAAARPLVEVDQEEMGRALEAARSETPAEAAPAVRWWWPFG